MEGSIIMKYRLSLDIGVGSIGSSTATTTALGGLSITGNLNVAGTNASSTFANGIQLSNGCFRGADNNCLVNSTAVGNVGASTAIGQMPYYGAVGTTLTATSSIFIATNQYVGIGTTSPNWLLQVSGIRPSLALSDYSASANLKHWLISSMGGNLYVGTSTDSYGTSTPAALTILNNGSLGLGSSSPSQRPFLISSAMW